MTNIVITGSSAGIGLATVWKFLQEDSNNIVYGIDRQPVLADYLPYAERYHHIQADVGQKDSLPEIPNVSVLINNAGVQQKDDIETNLLGVINCTERYAIQNSIKAVVNVASVSAHTGEEFPLYAASKGGVLSYTKNTAQRIAPFGATCNSISPGGVTTDLNAPVMNDAKKWVQIMSFTPLKKWATPEEIAEWIYFIATQKSMTGQDIVVDNGEMIWSKFVW